MVRFFRTRFMPDLRRGSVTVLAFLLCCGYLLGAFLTTVSGDYVSSMMRTAVTSRVSIVCLLPVILFPFLITAFAVYIGQFWILAPIAFCKAFSFGYLSSCILCSFGNSGWLIQLLFLFSDGVSLPILCWFWIRLLDSRGAKMNHSFAIVSVLIFLIVIFDCQFISPFLVSLLS